MGKKELAAARAGGGVSLRGLPLGGRAPEPGRREVRVCVPGHFQRGGPPCPYDRVLATLLGAAAAGCIREQRFGVMCAMVNGQVVPVELEKVAGKLKKVPEDCLEIRMAQEIGVSFGQ